jgi:hypothetical protein
MNNVVGEGLSFMSTGALFKNWLFVGSVILTVLSAGARVGVGGGVRVPYACVSVHGQG